MCFCLFFILGYNRAIDPKTGSKNWLTLIRVAAGDQFKASGHSSIIIDCVINRVIIQYLGCNVSAAGLYMTTHLPWLQSLRHFITHVELTGCKCLWWSVDPYCHWICLIASKCELATGRCKMTMHYALQLVCQRNNVSVSVLSWKSKCIFGSIFVFLWKHESSFLVDL